MDALTEQQTQFLFYIDVAGCPVSRACELSGISPHEANKMLKDPGIAHVREVRKAVARHRSKICIEDVNEGIRDAIDDAKTIVDPTAQIRGWVELARINGLDAPKKVQIEHVASSADAPSEQLRQLPSSELAKLVDENNIVDVVDFYEVRKQA
jgi:hypothetical protein